MARVVVVIAEPMPDVYTGFAIYTFQLLRSLAGRHDVHLIVLRGGEDPTATLADGWSVHNLSRRDINAKRARQVAAVCSGRTMQEMQIDYPGCVDALSQLLQRLEPDVVFLNHVRAAWVARKWARPPCPVVYIAHNCEAAVTGSLSRMGFNYPTRMALRWDARKVRSLEAKILDSADSCVCLSDEDAARFRKWSVCADFEVIPPAVDPVSTSPASHRKIPHSLLLMGSYEWTPKRRNAVWLATRVMAQVRARCPEATLRIVGKGATRLADELGAVPGVTLHSDVASVAPFYEAAEIAVVPEQQASGVKLKTLEAANYGLPIVTTSSGREGTMLLDRIHCLVADGEAGLSAAIVEMLKNPALRQKLADAARERVQERFSPRRVSALIDQLVSRLCERSPSLCAAAR